MAKIIEFPTGVDLVAAKATAGKRIDKEHALMRLARFYVDMNHLTGPSDIFVVNGRVAQTSLEFVEQVCDTIGYHKGSQSTQPPDGAA